MARAGANRSAQKLWLFTAPFMLDCPSRLRDRAFTAARSAAHTRVATYITTGTRVNTLTVVVMASEAVVFDGATVYRGTVAREPLSAGSMHHATRLCAVSASLCHAATHNRVTEVEVSASAIICAAIAAVCAPVALCRRWTACRCEAWCVAHAWCGARALCGTATTVLCVTAVV